MADAARKRMWRNVPKEFANCQKKESRKPQKEKKKGIDRLEKSFSTKKKEFSIVRVPLKGEDLRVRAKVANAR